MTLRDSLLPVVHAARGLVSALGMHQTSVVVRTRTWSSGRIQTGTPTDSSLTLGAPHPVTGVKVPPHVHGTSGDVEIMVGPLTPYNATTCPTGYTPQQLNPGDAPGVEYYYLVTFPDGVARRFVVLPRGLDTTRPMRVMVKLRADDRKVPF